MARQDALEKARRKPSLAHAPRFPAVACIVALLLVCLYSAFAIHRVVASNGSPTVTFTLGTAYRDVTYCNSQTLDVFVPGKAATRPLPLAIFVHGAGLTGGDKGYLNIAVGTALTGGPPHRSQRAGLPHWAPALGTGVKPRIREGMHNAGGRQPPIRQAVHAFPVQAGALAAAL